MATENSEPNHLKFTQLFPGFNGGIRELRYIVARFEINSDTYKNHESEIKRQIASQLPMPGWMDKMNGINKYLEESKVNIDAFEYMTDSRSQIYLIEQEITYFLKRIGVDSQAVRLLNSLPFRAKEKFIFLIDWWATNSVEKEKQVLNSVAKISNISREMKYLRWFDSDAEKVIAADDYFKRNHALQSERFNDAEDVRIYFYEKIANKDQRELIYQKIRSLYNNRKSRKNINTKQCNLSLSSSAYKNIGILAKKNRKTRSVIVDMFFMEMQQLRRFYEGKRLPEGLTIPDNNFTPSSGEPTPSSGEPTPSSGEPTPSSGEPTPSGEPTLPSSENIPPPHVTIDTSTGIYFSD